jgi:hypothetical protein
MTPEEMAAVKIIAHAMQSKGSEAVHASLAALALLGLLRSEGFTFTRIAPTAAVVSPNARGGSS